MFSGMNKVQAGEIEQPGWAKFLFNSTGSAWIWLILRVWLGWDWLEAGLHKATDPAWVATGEGLKGFWVRAVAIPPAPAKPAITYDWYRSFLQFLLDSGAHTWFGKVIAYGEVLVGIGLIVGALVGFAAFFGALMNLSFMLAGTVSTNPVMFLVAMLLLLAWKVAGYWGLDRLILPALGTPWYKGWLTGGHRRVAEAVRTA